jgi:protein SCO1/2
MKTILILLITVTLTLQVFSTEQTSRPPVGISEKLGNVVPLDESFYDEEGNLIPLRSVIDKPTIVTFVYYKCPGICSPLLTEVTMIVDKMDLQLGKDYQILTLSFDPDEKPDMAAEKRDNYLAEVHKSVDPRGWRFFTGDSASIHLLTDAAGFYFEKSGRDWLHAGALIILSPKGKVTRYLYGTKHLPFDVKMALTEASEGRTGPTIAKILSFCYSYDPEGRTYALNFTRIGGLVVVGLVGTFMLIFIIRPRKKTGER